MALRRSSSILCTEIRAFALVGRCVRRCKLPHGRLPPFECFIERSSHPCCRWKSSLRAAADSGVAASVGGRELVYDGIIFDMDGTLSVSCIDYALMRKSIDIPEGDLFTVMETWSDGGRIKRSMDTILEIEAVAAAASRGMPGLLELLSFLRSSSVRVGLVTRNTTESVDAFFSAVGEEWRDVFQILLTREHSWVKPDKRCLLHFAEAWGVPPCNLLMVGDSTEDVECGNAAGTATCLIAGGGNETSAAASAAPPHGAVPTFAVGSLPELQERLQQRDTGLGWGAHGTGTLDCFSSSDSGSEGEGGGGGTGDADAALPGAPPPGLSFLDALFAVGAVEGAACSFPRIDASRFGVPSDAHPGSKVLHLQCGSGALTKLLFSAGLLAVGADPAPAAAARRGLQAVAVPRLDHAGALAPAVALVGTFDAVVLYGGGGGGASPEGGDAEMERQLWHPEALAEISAVLRAGGTLAVESEAGASGEAEGRAALAEGAGFRVEVLEEGAVRVDGGRRVRLIARKPL